MAACWGRKEAPRITSSSLRVPNHSQQELNGACSAFQICHQLSGWWLPSSPNLPQRYCSGGAGRRGGLGPSPLPRLCRRDRKGSWWPAKACLYNGWSHPPGRGSRFLSNFLMTPDGNGHMLHLDLGILDQDQGLIFLSLHSRGRLEKIISKPKSSYRPHCPNIYR